MKILKSLIFIAILISGIGASAHEACPEVNPHYENWPALHFRQPGRGWCYGVILADLLSVQVHKPLSAIALANSVERSDDSYVNKAKAYIKRKSEILYRFSINGQPFLDALNVAKKEKVCTWSILDRLRDQPNIRDLFLDDVFANLEHQRRDQPEVFKATLHRLFDPLQRGFAEKLILQSEDKSKPLIDLAMDLSCVQKVDVATYDLESITLGKTNDDAETINKLNSLLTHGTAVEIGYHEELLTHPQSAERERANHSSIIVGQFMDSKDQTCKYIIRATDLHTCDLVDKSVPCVNGYFVVPREEAISAAGQLMWLRH